MDTDEIDRRLSDLEADRRAGRISPREAYQRHEALLRARRPLRAAPLLPDVVLAEPVAATPVPIDGAFLVAAVLAGGATLALIGGLMLLFWRA